MLHAGICSFCMMGQVWRGDEIGEGLGQSKALAASERSSCIVGGGDSVL